jgi:hypothetical protein
MTPEERYWNDIETSRRQARIFKMIYLLSNVVVFGAWIWMARSLSHIQGFEELSTIPYGFACVMGVMSVWKTIEFLRSGV